MKRQIIDPSKLELNDRVVNIKRVSKTVKGGRTMKFSALVVVGDGNGHVGIGLGKAGEVPEAIRKGKEAATKSLVEVRIDENSSVPHDYTGKFGSASVLLKRAPEGTGIIAGGPARAVLELAGYKNIRSKSLGSNNKTNVCLATLAGLAALKTPEEIAELRDAFNYRAIVGHPVGENAFCRPGSVGTGQEAVNIEADKLYRTWDKDVEYEELETEDAEIIIAAYGISARIGKVIVRELRKEGVKIGMLRPIKLSPFPYEAFENLDFNRVKGILNVEMSIPAQMRWDVDHAVKGRTVIKECLRSGGQLLTNDQVMEAARELIKEVL